MQLSERLSRAFTFQYRVAYRNVTLSNLKIIEGAVPVLAQPGKRPGVATFTVIEDKRDDPTDAHHGSYTTADLSYAPGFLAPKLTSRAAYFAIPPIICSAAIWCLPAVLNSA